jgi:hypothetical protein
MDFSHVIILKSGIWIPYEESRLRVNFVAIEELTRHILWSSIHVKNIEWLITFCVRVLNSDPQETSDTELIGEA